MKNIISGILAVFYMIFLLFFRDKFVSKDIVAVTEANQIILLLNFLVFEIGLIGFLYSFDKKSEQNFWEKRSYRKEHSPFYRRDLIISIFAPVIYLILLLLLSSLYLFPRFELTPTQIRKVNILNKTARIYSIQNDVAKAEIGLQRKSSRHSRTEYKQFIDLYADGKKIHFFGLWGYSISEFYNSYQNAFSIKVSGKRYFDNYLKQHSKMSQAKIKDLDYVLSLETEN